MSPLAYITSSAYKDWILLVLGGAVGLGFNYLPFLIRYLFRLKQVHLIEGSWHSYYFNFENNVPVFKHELFKIQKGILTDFAVSVVNSDQSGPSYNGKLDYENGFYLITLRSGVPGWDEVVHIRFKGFVPSDSPRVIGLGLARDFHNCASSNVVLLTKSPCTEAEVKNLIMTGTQVGMHGRIIRVL
jgi:hypothetical protein